MVTRKQSIENFSNKMDELINCKYILTAKKITAVLKAVTSSRLFFELIVFCNEDYDYKAKMAEFQQSASPFCFDSDKDLIAFGINFLTALDANEEDLLAILSKNYQSDNVDRGYSQFANEFLVPFKNAMLKCANAMINDCNCKNHKDEPQKGDAKNLTGKATKGEQMGELKKNYSACYEDLQQSIANERSLIMCSKLGDQDKSDLYILLEMFKDSVFMGNREQIRTSFISYKYAAISFKKLNSEVDEIERILKFCKVI